MLIGGCIDQCEFINAEYRFAENEIEDEQINHRNSLTLTVFRLATQPATNSSVSSNKSMTIQMPGNNGNTLKFLSK